MEKIIDIISRNYEGYTRSHQAVAAYLMDNYDESVFMTLEQLSASAGVSTTTVIRFARELGFSGYAALQQALRIDLRTRAALPARTEQIGPIPQDELLREVVYTDINNIQETFRMLDNQAAEEAVRAITEANQIYLLGLRRSYALAVYSFSRLGQVRDNVRMIGTPGLNYPEEILSVSKGDVCLAFLFPRYNRTTISILEYMKKRGAVNVIVTSVNHVAIDKYADVVLPCETRCISGKTSYVAPIAMINYLIASYMGRSREKSREMLSRTEEILSSGMFLGL